MKWFFNILISTQAFALSSVIIYYPKNIDKKSVVEPIINNQFYFPQNFITYIPTDNNCESRTDTVLTICISQDKETNELGLEITNADWEFWKRNKNNFLKETI